MTGTPLQRLCAHRGVAVPGDGRLLDLAPVFGLRAADLLAIAGGEIPGEFMPADPGARRHVTSAIRWTWLSGLSPGQIAEVLDYARSMSAAPGVDTPAGVPALATVTFGGVFSRLMSVRNLEETALAYATVSSRVTVRAAMRDVVDVLSAERLLLMATAFCLRADDLEAMAGRTGDQPADPVIVGWVPRVWTVGELVWALTPLQAEQIKAVVAFAYGLHTSAASP